MVDGEVVDAGPGDERRRGDRSSGMPVPGMAKPVTSRSVAMHHARRVELEGGGGEVAVEEVVEVLVGGHPGHEVVADRIAEQLAGVAVGDAGGQLLQREVDEAVVRRRPAAGTWPVDTWHMRPRSRATGSMARVTIR